MAYWLFKSEPNTYSYDDLVRDGEGEWDGVRNFQARQLPPRRDQGGRRRPSSTTATPSRW